MLISETVNSIYNDQSNDFVRGNAAGVNFVTGGTCSNLPLNPHQYELNLGVNQLLGYNSCYY